MTPTEELRKRLDELGIAWKPWDGVHPITVWHDGQFSYEYMERTLLDGVKPYTGEVVDGTGRLEAVIHVCSPEQAIAATVSDKPKDNPRNYNPDGTPKIPNMHIGADPDWVDWVASLKHEEPLNLKEAVEQIMFETICSGGDMGPNDCGGENCPDEGMVYTNDFINGWVNKIAATLGAGTCYPVPIYSFNGEFTKYYCDACSECGTEWDGDTPNFCPNCGAKVVSE